MDTKLRLAISTRLNQIYGTPPEAEKFLSFPRESMFVFSPQDLELMTRFFEHYKICPTSIEPLIIYDMSKDRGNVPNPERDYYIKEKYLSQFETLFERRGIKNEVMHRSWYLCAENAMLANDMEIYGKAQNKLKQYGALTQAERIRIYKKKIIKFIMRMLK